MKRHLIAAALFAIFAQACVSTSQKTNHAHTPNAALHKEYKASKEGRVQFTRTPAPTLSPGSISVSRPVKQVSARAAASKANIRAHSANVRINL